MTYLGLDLGTSGVKALLTDDAQEPVAEGHASLSVQRPAPDVERTGPPGVDHRL
jgi:xylulokinase